MPKTLTGVRSLLLEARITMALLQVRLAGTESAAAQRKWFTRQTFQKGLLEQTMLERSYAEAVQASLDAALGFFPGKPALSPRREGRAV